MSDALMDVETSKVRAAFNDTPGYLRQQTIYRNGNSLDARELARAVVLALAPSDLLEVGCGTGDFASSIVAGVGSITAVDVAPVMVDEARSRGIDARVADARKLPFPDDSFDCLVANWVFHYMSNPAPALAEAARVLRSGGHLVAGTLSERHLGEVWHLVLGTDAIVMSFGRENGIDLLGEHFDRVHRIDVDGTVEFPDRDAVVGHIARSIDGASLAASVPSFQGPLCATRRASVFVARVR